MTNRHANEPIKELVEKHRSIKESILKLLTRAENPRITKHAIKDELFKIYLELK